MVRNYRSEDKTAIERIHAQQGVDYRFPDIDNPLFFVRKVLEVDGQVHAAAMLKVCAETYLLLGPGEPRARLTAIEQLQTAVLDVAYAKGLDEIHAAVPEIGFDKRLIQLGWQKDRPSFHLWTRSTR